MTSDEIQFSNPRPLHSAEVNSVELAKHRRELADKLRTEHPGQWAVISDGHVSIKSAGVVRRRLRDMPYWAGFEMTSRKSEDGEGFCIHARYMGTATDEQVASATKTDDVDA